MSQENEGGRPHERRKERAFLKWVYGVGTMLGLGLLVYLAGIIIPALLTTGEPSKHEMSVAKILEQKQDLPRTGSMVVEANDPTSGTVRAGASAALRYSPFIATAPGLPKALKDARGQINVRWDQILARIAQYENSPERLDFKKSGEVVDGIYRDYLKLWSEMVKIAGGEQGIAVGALEATRKRNREFHAWLFGARVAGIENEARKGRRATYSTAARYAAEVRVDNIIYWKNCDGVTPPDYSAYLRDTGNADYNREIYYLRQTGDWFETVSAIDLALMRHYNRMLPVFKKAGNIVQGKSPKP